MTRHARTRGPVCARALARAGSRRSRGGRCRPGPQGRRRRSGAPSLPAPGRRHRRPLRAPSGPTRRVRSGSARSETSESSFLSSLYDSAISSLQERSRQPALLELVLRCHQLYERLEFFRCLYFLHEFLTTNYVILEKFVILLKEKKGTKVKRKLHEYSPDYTYKVRREQQ